MKLNLCIASRGNPVNLCDVIVQTDARVIDYQNTIISVALDNDDDSIPDVPDTQCQVVWDIGEREDSLGAKYNRAARNSPADVYILGADDNIFTTDGWDEKVREAMGLFPDNFGFVYFGRLDGTLPTQMAVPQKLIEIQGSMFPEHWPFWYHDTWTDEIAHMTGRILWVDIDVKEIGGRGKTRGIQEVPFWTTLFDALRPQRVATAEKLSGMFNPVWIDTQLKQRRNVLDMFFTHRMMRLRNPATAIHFERRMSHEDEDKNTECYRRIKARAEETMAKLGQVAA